jgi:hypothetical protein
VTLKLIPDYAQGNNIIDDYLIQWLICYPKCGPLENEQSEKAIDRDRFFYLNFLNKYNNIRCVCQS